jgi:lysophospholipid acyltransferase (LPLAT)-like uncharacterized protein
MLKRLTKSGFIQYLLSKVAAAYIRLVFYTSRWEYKNTHIPEAYLAANKPFLTCFWHNRLLMLCYAWQSKKSFYMLISSHKDGKLISKTMDCFGIKTVAGSTARGGTEALREILKIFKAGHVVGITPDGPRGPAFKVSDGTITIARLGKVDILPVTFATSRGKTLKTWDKFFLAYPFSKGVMMWGEPIKCPKNTVKSYNYNRSVATSLQKLTKAAEEFVKS